jgi:hypothetical protein
MQAPPQLDPATQKIVVDAALKLLTFGGSIIAAIAATIAFFLKRYWDTRDRKAGERERLFAAKEAERVRLKNILYESLKWFEGGTQKRSIGIAVVKTSWDAYSDFRSLWTEVFVNQALYLLAASDSGVKAHEQENLGQILALLAKQRALIHAESKELLCKTIDEKQRHAIKTGLDLTEEFEKRLPKSLTELRKP